MFTFLSVVKPVPITHGAITSGRLMDLGLPQTSPGEKVPVNRVKGEAGMDVAQFSVLTGEDEGWSLGCLPGGPAAVPGRPPRLLLQRHHQLQGPGRVPDNVFGEALLLCQQGQVQGSEKGHIIREILVI